MPVPQSVSDIAVAVRDYSGAAVAAGAVVVGVMSYVGVGFTAPWPDKADVSQMQKNIEIIQQQQSKQIARGDDLSCTIYQLLKDRYLKEQADAEADLIKSPSSSTLQRARDEAQGNVIKINAKLNSPPCL